MRSRDRGAASGGSASKSGSLGATTNPADATVQGGTVPDGRRSSSPSHWDRRTGYGFGARSSRRCLSRSSHSGQPHVPAFMPHEHMWTTSGATTLNHAP